MNRYLMMTPWRRRPLLFLRCPAPCVTTPLPDARLSALPSPGSCETREPRPRLVASSDSTLVGESLTLVPPDTHSFQYVGTGPRFLLKLRGETTSLLAH